MTTQPSDGIDNRATPREWIGLAVLALPTLLLSIDLSVLYLAIPHLAADLGATGTQQLWIMDIYGFMIAGLLITMGTLGDRIGRRRLLLIGAAAFGAASVAAAYSVSAEMLIATRALLGIAGATLMPSTLALISNMFRNPAQRGMAIGVWMSCFMGGMAFGPVVGGAMLESFWWGSVFLLGVPVMLLLLVTGPVLIPEYRVADPGRLDPVSVFLSLVSILPVVYALKEYATHGVRVEPTVALLAGLVFAVLFVKRQLRIADPLVDVRLFLRRAFSSALGLHLLVGAIQGGSLLLITLYLQMVVGLSPLATGLWLVPTALATMAGAMLAPAIARRVRPAYVIAGGLLVSVLGYLLLTGISGEGELPLVLGAFALVMLGVGPTGALATGMIVGSAPPERAGSAASLAETGAELGVALGIAALGSLGTVIYRGQLDGNLPDTLGNAADASRESIAGAVAAADALSPAQGTELLDLARHAFATSLTGVAIIGAALFVTLAVTAIVMLRDVEPSVEETEPTNSTAA
ncbi:DHA2 family multidrug resistance protein-like MFS transporter [Stackebrandtia endophytica]|uniref:DHA2 family multidrug resistance protein-like MFS transporter n=1 Tax=Stackebrandtia endophytica TaxID=1496996 RepID=A0A543AW37_9ACTN|nr:MFS transporter [Stackebrandtia endophytica]TQL76803.1 DHA2 family multidrug resistance protein-like MFS transporter [Stackebrandtia endophytica]